MDVVIEFAVYYIMLRDRSVYVGFTKSPMSRVKNHINTHGNEIDYVLLERVEEKSEALRLESYWLHQFIAWGFVVHNKNKRFAQSYRRVRKMTIIHISDNELALWRSKMKSGDMRKIALAIGYTDESIRIVFERRRATFPVYEAMKLFYQTVAA